MFLIYQFFLFLHITVGFASLILFWLPAVAKKGGKLHQKSGHWYANTMYAVGFSALILSLMLIIDPIAFKYNNKHFSQEELVTIVKMMQDIGVFLFAISMLVLVNICHGLQTIKSKNNHIIMRSFINILVNIILCIVGLYLMFKATQSSTMTILLYVFSVLCIITSINNLRYCLKKSVSRNEQIIAHLSSMIGAGIGSHTAFFVFGASKVLSELLTGYVAIIPWVLPTIVGTVFIQQQAKRYKKTR